ncbi:N-acetylmuramoyl-L-alanine amidase [Neobacillus notoginsengisoli]|uniref:N-acetylmuramoyl-L-alanine amidase n=1 Tax=Neobacillus notoginsengisoli TaxID=1578198 RepID=A0A417YSE6_9BACI|nr:N-acetylmuramoyl-L-alanine amidase [Neobacillus notoginsengisoli]RHW38911.1 N-acetylmuramoyl-L-alanine amidase [Neobacillus notoginsengisoli]
MKIMLDAGHGYSTAGKRSPSGMREYEFNRAVANFAKKELETYQNVTVYFAHSDDRDVPLKERTDKANKLGIDVYVAIHANAYQDTWNSANGIDTFVYVTKPREAVDLAQKVQRHLVAKTGLRDRGVKTANFHVLRETKMTSMLAECGFMTNREEEALLRSDTYRMTCAKAITAGIVEQYGLKKKPVAPKPVKSLYKVQVGAFRDKSHADELVKKVTAKGYQAFAVKDKDGLYKVQAGAFTKKENADALVKKLKADGFEAFVYSE